MQTLEVPQWQDGLKRANAVRVHRAEQKRKLKDREVELLEVLSDPMCSTMQVHDALMALPDVGRTRVSGALRKLQIGATHPCGTLTPRQRCALADWFRPSPYRPA